MESSRIMSNVLTECHLILVDNLTPTRILDNLLANGCINMEEHERVHACKGEGSHEQNRKLLEILRTKPRRALDVLMTCLVEDGTQMHLVDSLHNSIEKHQLVAAHEIEESGLQSKILPEKWWPDKKLLIESFVERSAKDGKSLTEHLHEQIHSTLWNATVITTGKQTLVGMGGIGKSTTAKKFANAYESEYTHIIWIDSEGEMLQNSFSRLAAALKVAKTKAQDTDDLAKEMYRTLRDTKCLFIFDNAEVYSGEHGLKDHLPRNELHHSIITSRNHDWGNENEFGEIPTFPLQLFTEAECVELLSNTLGKSSRHVCQSSEEDMLALGKKLGFLPLALQCAVATICKSSRFKPYTLKTYLERISEDMKVLTGKKILTEYDKSISATLQITIEQIKQDENIDHDCRELSITILHLLAYQETSEEFLCSLPNARKFVIDDAIELLLTYSFVSVSSDYASTRFFSMHRLLQHLIRHKLGLDRNEAIRIISIGLETCATDFELFSADVFWYQAQKYDEILTKYPYFVHELSCQYASIDATVLMQESLEPLGRALTDGNLLPILLIKVKLAHLYAKEDSLVKALEIAAELNCWVATHHANDSISHEGKFYANMVLAFVYYKIFLAKNAFNDSYVNRSLELYEDVLGELHQLRNPDGTLPEIRQYDHLCDNSTLNKRETKRAFPCHIASILDMEKGIEHAWTSFITSTGAEQTRQEALADLFDKFLEFFWDVEQAVVKAAVSRNYHRYLQLCSSMYDSHNNSTINFTDWKLHLGILRPLAKQQIKYFSDDKKHLGEIISILKTITDLEMKNPSQYGEMSFLEQQMQIMNGRLSFELVCALLETVYDDCVCLRHHHTSGIKIPTETFVARYVTLNFMYFEALMKLGSFEMALKLETNVQEVLEKYATDGTFDWQQFHKRIYNTNDDFHFDLTPLSTFDGSVEPPVPVLPSNVVKARLANLLFIIQKSNFAERNWESRSIHSLARLFDETCYNLAYLDSIHQVTDLWETIGKSVIKEVSSDVGILWKVGEYTLDLLGLKNQDKQAAIFATRLYEKLRDVIGIVGGRQKKNLVCWKDSDMEKLISILMKSNLAMAGDVICASQTRISEDYQNKFSAVKSNVLRLMEWIP